MKVKMIEREPFHMVGAVQYGQAKHSYKRNQNGSREHFEQKDFEMPDFEKAFNKFGEAMQNFGKHIEKNAPGWNRDIKDFGENFEQRADDFGKRAGDWAEGFGKRMDEWGNSFGKKMEAWGNDFGSRMQRWGDNVESRWEDVWCGDEGQTPEMDEMFEHYPVYNRFLKIYEAIIKDSDHLKNDRYFYEISVMEDGETGTESMMMIASEITGAGNFNYPVVRMSFDAYRWLIVKLTKEEYNKDWMGKLSQHELLEGYALDDFFIVRHPFDDEEKDMIKIFCPLRKIDDDRENEQ